MPFRSSNALASFQGNINKIIVKKLDIFVIVYLNDIFIYTKDPGQGYVEVVRWVPDFLRINSLFANLKKCRFHKDEIRFLEYVVLSQDICMEDKKIEAVRNWLEPKSVRDIQVFISFVNFYQIFIQGFNRIAIPLTSILKTTGLSGLSAPKAFKAENNEVVECSSRADKMVFKSRMLKNKKSEIWTHFGAMEEPIFLTPNTKKAFNPLRQAFIKASILQHFDPEYYIQIETNVSGYTISGVLSELISDQVTLDSKLNLTKKSYFGQWHQVAYFSRKMILVETWYEMHDAELLAIVKAFKT